MKATGIVRRIDDLGRVVIPKEIRRTLRIKEGTPLEIFTDREGEVILKKYSPIGELSVFAKEYAEALSQTTGLVSCITDHDQVVAAAGQGSREYSGKGISKELEATITAREGKCFNANEKGKIPVVENQKEINCAQTIQPIICAGDAIGAVILMGKSEKDVFEILKRCWCRRRRDFWEDRWNSKNQTWIYKSGSEHHISEKERQGYSGRFRFK